MRRNVASIAFTRSRVAAELDLPLHAREQLEKGADGSAADRLSPTVAAIFPRSAAPSSGGSSRATSWASSRRTRSSWGSTSAPSTPRCWSDSRTRSRAPGSRPGAQAVPRAPSVAVVVAYDDPIDQYLMRHPEYFFAQNPESAVIDPSNPYVLAAHLACAAHELP